MWKPVWPDWKDQLIVIKIEVVPVIKIMIQSHKSHGKLVRVITMTWILVTCAP